MLENLSTYSYILAIHSVLVSTKLIPPYINVLPFVNIHLVTLLVAVISSYITHVVEKIKFALFSYEFVFTNGVALLAIDLLFHWLPFILTWTFVSQSEYTLQTTVITFGLLSIYVLWFDFYEIYFFTNKKLKKDIHFAMFFALVLYVLLNFVLL